MAEPQTIFEYLKQGGLLALACLLGWLAKGLLERLFVMYERRLAEKDERYGAQLAEKDRRIAALEEDNRQLRRDLGEERQHWQVFSRESVPVMKEVALVAARRRPA